MFERFSAESRAVCVSAGREASRFGHDAVRTEHLLVGLLSPGAGRVPAWLAIEGVYLADIRERLWGTGAADDAARPFPRIGPEARLALEQACQESAALDQGEVRPEHILLAVLSEVDGVAARVLAEAGASVGHLRRQVLAVLTGGSDQD